jgi:hypothetical protein
MWARGRRASPRVDARPGILGGKRARFARRKQMEPRHLGNQGLIVSAMGLGCMGMSDAYGPADEAESLATIHRALDLGISLLDTSDAYGPFINEELVGKAIRGRRDEVMPDARGPGADRPGGPDRRGQRGTLRGHGRGGPLNRPPSAPTSTRRAREGLASGPSLARRVGVRRRSGRVRHPGVRRSNRLPIGNRRTRESVRSRPLFVPSGDPVLPRCSDSPSLRSVEFRKGRRCRAGVSAGRRWCRIGGTGSGSGRRRRPPGRGCRSARWPSPGVRLRPP